jgi:ATP-binding protein involved in chromosome partitioning
MDDASATRPIRIEQASPSELGITWSDGRESRYAVRGLRLACGCAHCVDEWSGEPRLDVASVPEDVHPLKIQPVGRYAIQIDWSDGHSTGIYTFRQLRAIDAEMKIL